MNNDRITESIATIFRRRWITRVAALSGACVVALQAAPHAHALQQPPPVPTEIQVPEGNRLLRVGHAIGTQNYICLPATMKPVDWVLLGPQATLFNAHDRQVMTHFQSPNFDETGAPMRPTWQDSSDTTAVWAKKTGETSDPAYVALDAIAWLRLEIVGRDLGSRGRGSFQNATFIQRLNTSGGKAPATGCTDATHIGARVQVPYEADYFFFRSIGPLE